MFKQWEMELILDLINDKLDSSHSRVWIQQLTELKATILETEYEEETEIE